MQAPFLPQVSALGQPGRVCVPLRVSTRAHAASESVAQAQDAQGRVPQTKAASAVCANFLMALRLPWPCKDTCLPCRR